MQLRFYHMITDSRQIYIKNYYILEIQAAIGKLLETIFSKYWLSFIAWILFLYR